MAAGWHKFTGNSQYPELTHNENNSSFCYGVKADRKFRLPWVSFRKQFYKNITTYYEPVLKILKMKEILALLSNKKKFFFESLFFSALSF